MNTLRVLACTAILMFAGNVHAKPVDIYIVQGKATPILKAFAQSLSSKHSALVVEAESLAKFPQAVKDATDKLATHKDTATVVGVLWNDGQGDLDDYSRKIAKSYSVPVYDFQVTNSTVGSCMTHLTVYDDGIHGTSFFSCGTPLVLLSVPYHYQFTELEKDETGTIKYPLENEPPRYLWSQAFQTWYPTKY